MKTYCLDANFFIQAWSNYYSPEFCPDFWEILVRLSNDKIIFIPEMVKEEIDKIDDDLKKWIEDNKIYIKPIDDEVQKCLKEIWAKDKNHKKLVDTARNRSIADPWVIAHAMAENAVVVTNEQKIIESTTGRIKIPNVAEKMGIECIDIFKFIKKLNFKFSCKLPYKEDE